MRINDLLWILLSLSYGLTTFSFYLMGPIRIEMESFSSEHSKQWWGVVGRLVFILCMQTALFGLLIRGMVGYGVLYMIVVTATVLWMLGGTVYNIAIYGRIRGFIEGVKAWQENEPVLDDSVLVRYHLAKCKASELTPIGILREWLRSIWKYTWLTRAGGVVRCLLGLVLFYLFPFLPFFLLTLGSVLARRTFDTVTISEP